MHERMKKDRGRGRVREEKWRNSGSGIQCQVGRIRRILNRRNPIRPGNGMSSFPSVLSLPKIRGISAIKIRVFDYQRFSRPPFLHRVLSFPFVTPSLSSFSVFHRYSPQISLREFNESFVTDIYKIWNRN